MPDGVTVAIWQGRGGTHLETGEPMCGDPEAVEAALKTGANVEEVACKSKTARCALYDTLTINNRKPPRARPTPCMRRTKRCFRC